MASIKVTPQPQRKRPDTSNPEVVKKIWADAEKAARKEIRRNAMRNLRTAN